MPAECCAHHPSGEEGGLTGIYNSGDRLLYMLGHFPLLTRSIISVAPVALFRTLSKVLSCVNTSTRTQPFSGFSVHTNDPPGLFSAVKALVDIEEVMPLAGAASLCGGMSLLSRGVFSVFLSYRENLRPLNSCCRRCATRLSSPTLSPFRRALTSLRRYSVRTPAVLPLTPSCLERAKRSS